MTATQVWYRSCPFISLSHVLPPQLDVILHETHTNRERIDMIIPPVLICTHDHMLCMYFSPSVAEMRYSQVSPHHQGHDSLTEATRTTSCLNIAYSPAYMLHVLNLSNKERTKSPPSQKKNMATYLKVISLFFVIWKWISRNSLLSAPSSLALSHE